MCMAKTTKTWRFLCELVIGISGELYRLNFSLSHVYSLHCSLIFQEKQNQTKDNLEPSLTDLQICDLSNSLRLYPLLPNYLPPPPFHYDKNAKPFLSVFSHQEMQKYLLHDIIVNVYTCYLSKVFLLLGKFFPGFEH